MRGSTKAPDSFKERRRFVWWPTGEYEVLSEVSRSPISWIGGKSYLAKWIIKHFPPHKCYVEPFGGAASVLLQKPPSDVEVYNDVDGHVVEFFEVLKNDPWQLVSILEHMPYSRLLYEGMLKIAKANAWPRDKTKRVAMWLYMQIGAFAGKRYGGWGHGKSVKIPRKLDRLATRLVEVSNRLRNVQIETADFRKIIATYDSADTLFYCDPPYFDAEFYYDAPFCLKDHRNLAEILHKVKGKVCLSYSPHPKVDELYAGWNRDSKMTTTHSFGITKYSKHKHRPKRTELLLMNF
ncbi:MAG: DNA adenine methylase [Candidatus Bathyarchaeota archaeon]|nr:DNA adenine methylase [Candidatus Bathyarchaeota archaeon]